MLSEGSGMSGKTKADHVDGNHCRRGDDCRRDPADPSAHPAPDLRGAVIRQDADPTKELPLADVEIAALSNGSVIGEGKSDASGFFTVMLRNRLWIGRPVTLKFRHADYQPLDLQDFVGDKLYVAHMVPLSP